MPVDIFRDDRPQSVSAETPPAAQPAASSSPWSTTIGVVTLCIGLVLSTWAVLHHRGDVNPDVDPAPAPTSGLHVLIIEETEERAKLPASQIAIFSSIPLRKWYDEHCAKEDGITAYRNFDKDDALDKENEIWQTLRKRMTLSPPAVLMVDGKRGKEMKLPDSPESLQAELEKFAKSKR